MTVIQAYAPTNVSTDHKKLEFYNHLQETLNEIPRHDIKILIGDFNTQTDSNREGQECTIVPHSSGNTKTDNGELLIEFCSFNGLCIGNFYFKHKDIHKKRGTHLTEQPTMNWLSLHQ